MVQYEKLIDHDLNTYVIVYTEATGKIGWKHYSSELELESVWSMLPLLEE